MLQFEDSHMASPAPSHLAPRKRPRQARATATLDVIFEATLQVLIGVGPQRLTTTRVAERAGVSVGTLYQYFPQKQALIYALNERYLALVAERVEATCAEMRGAAVAAMVRALVTTYWRAKTERPEATRTLYRSVAELDTDALVAAFAARVDRATETMLASAADATFADPRTVTLTLLTTIFGTVRGVFERDLRPQDADAVLGELIRMGTLYLAAVRLAPADV